MSSMYSTGRYNDGTYLLEKYIAGWCGCYSYQCVTVESEKGLQKLECMKMLVILVLSGKKRKCILVLTVGTTEKFLFCRCDTNSCVNWCLGQALFWWGGGEEGNFINA